MSDAKAIMEMIKENDITYVDLRFTDPRGKIGRAHVELQSHSDLVCRLLLEKKNKKKQTINKKNITL